MNIQEVRAKFPQYNDLSDADLASALHRKFYADIPYDEFAGKIGIKQQPGTSASGIAVEGGKGLLRGASDVGMMIAKGAARVLDPSGILGAGAAIESIAAPSRERVAANPQNEAERFAGTAGELAGAGVTGGITRPLTNIVLPAIAGAAGEQVAGETGKILGSFSPAVIQAASGATKVLARSTGPEAAQRLSTMEQAGIQPTLADIAPSRAAFQSAIGKLPVASVITNKAIESQANQLKNKIDELIPSAGASKATAGTAIQEGLKQWKSGFYETWKQLDEKTSQLMGNPSSKAVQTNETLGKLSSRIDDPALNEIFQNPKIAQLKDAFSKGDVPVNVLIQVRREVGQMLGSKFAELKSDFNAGELKALYGSLSKDIEQVAKDTGNPAVLQAIKRQNAYYAAGSDRIESYFNRLVKQANPEKVFDALQTGSKKGAVEVRTVMKSLPVEARDEVVSATLSRMGQVRPSDQTAAGTKFSAETFLTQWNQLNPEAKVSLFSGSSNHQMLKDLDTIAQAASVMRQSGKALFNPSGTGPFLLQGGPLLAMFYAPLETLSMIGGATAGSVLMTNPKFIRWLAQATTFPPGAAQSYVARLAQIANEEGGEFKEAVSRYADALSQ